MPRHFPFTFQLDGGKANVGYSLKKRGAYYRVQFAHPTIIDKYCELSTGMRTIGDAHIEAAKIVLKTYRPENQHPSKATWDDVVKELAKTTTLRPKSIADYLSSIRLLRSILPTTQRPSDVTPELANRFKRLYSAQGFTRSNDSDAKVYPRKAKTVENALRKLSCLWNVHFKELGYVNTNPWDNIARPDIPEQPVIIPNEAHFGQFFQYIQDRYPDWQLLHDFITVKSIAGCRTWDICAARSIDLHADGRLTLVRTKTKVPRTVPLPADLSARLNACKGRMFLWEQFAEDAKHFRPVKSGNKPFTPKTLYWCISNLFREYNEAHPEAKVKPHDLRKRAITLTTLAEGGSVDSAAEAIGIDAQTARRYYNDATKAFRTDELMQRMADILRPKTAPESSQKES